MKPIPRTRPTRSQSALYYDAVRMAGEVNLLFLDLVKEGLTREELATNIQRRPCLWQRFATWLDHLPSSQKETIQQTR